MRRLLGWTCVAAGLAVLVGVAFWLQRDDRQTETAQVRLQTELPAAPVVRRSTPPVARPVPVGHALAVLRIPRLGRDWSWVTVEGTSPAVLTKGPGHYSATPLPGARGNVAFAGHRAGHGDPFLDFDRLRPGDRVVFEQAGVRWLYVLDRGPRIIDVTDDWVLDPLPGRRLTLTTCWPRYGSSRRMYVRGHLAAVRG